MATIKSLRAAMRTAGLVDIDADPDTADGLVGAVGGVGNMRARETRADQIARDLRAAGYAASVAVDRNAPDVWVYAALDASLTPWGAA